MQHSVKVQDLNEDGPFTPRRRTTMFVGFDGSSMPVLADEINRWLADNPEWRITSVHHACSSANEEYDAYTALLEVTR